MSINQKLQAGQQLRQGVLNDAIRVVATRPWEGRHDAATVIVICDDADVPAIQAVIDAHLATDWAAVDAATAARLAAIDDAIKQDNVMQQIKGMTNAEFDAWWAANVTNAAQAITVLKRIVRLAARKL